MTTTTTHDLGNHETASTGISGPDADGYYTALTRTRSKRFRRRARAEAWLWRRGYLPDGRQRPAVDEAAAAVAKLLADNPQLAAYRERLRQRGMLVPDGTLPPGYHVIGAEPPAAALLVGHALVELVDSVPVGEGIRSSTRAVQFSAFGRTTQLRVVSRDDRLEWEARSLTHRRGCDEWGAWRFIRTIDISDVLAPAQLVTLAPGDLAVGLVAP